MSNTEQNLHGEDEASETTKISEKTIGERINEANSIDELCNILLGIGEIQGSKETYKGKDLVKMIQGIQQQIFIGFSKGWRKEVLLGLCNNEGKWMLGFTAREGLREKVAELLEKEIVKLFEKKSESEK